MSRNRDTTRCACNLWDFDASDGQVKPDDTSLLSQEQVWGDGCPPMGSGFRADLSGNVYMWRVRGEDGTVRCSSHLPFRDAQRELAWSYAVPNPSDRYRWRRLDCPLCRRRYAGWYVQQPASLDAPVFELYDTSYWHALDDEPAPEDVAGVITWTPNMLAEAAREYLARRGKA